MNFLKKLFTNQRERDLLMFISSLQQDKEKLQEENQQLKERLFNLMTNQSDKQKLNKKEKFILDLYNSKPNITLDELSKKTKLKISSLKVYISHIRKKGYNLDIN